MKFRQGKYSTKDFNQEVKRILDMEDALVTVYSNPVTEEVCGFTASLDSKAFEKERFSHLLRELSIDEDTLLFVQNSTPDERVELKRLALIKYHQTELKRLENSTPKRLLSN